VNTPFTAAPSPDKPAKEIRLPPRPPVADDALAWKERYVRGAIVPGAGRAARLHPAILVALGVGVYYLADALATWIFPPMPPPGRNLFTMFFPGGMAVMLWVVGAGTTGATSVGVERERRTLDALRTLPVERSEILRAKWHAAVWNPGRVFGWVLIGIAAAAVAHAGLHPLSPVVTAVYVYGLLWLAAAVGLWLSTRCATAAAASSWTLLFLFVGAAALLAIAGLLRAAGVLPNDSPFSGMWLSPLLAWGTLVFPLDEGSSWPFPMPVGERIVAAVVGCGLWLGLAALAWRAAVRKFDQEGSRWEPSANP
jgi:hypothetical protein